MLLSEEQEDTQASGVGKQLGFPTSPFYSGSHFRGHQQSKGNKYQVEVILQVRELGSSTRNGPRVVTALLAA